MQYTYNTTGVCARQVSFDLTNGIVRGISFYGGCSGNQQGVAHLAEGMNVDEVITRLKGIRCGGKPTSCPDQLAKALIAAKEQQNK